MTNVGENIKRYRQLKGLTLLEVANKLGVKEATVQRYESGAIKNLKYETIVQLGKLFDVSPTVLLGWEGEPDFATNNEFVTLFESMSDHEKSDVMDYIRYVISKRK